jgi:hypothetical protein
MLGMTLSLIDLYPIVGMVLISATVGRGDAKSVGWPLSILRFRSQYSGLDVIYF